MAGYILLSIVMFVLFRGLTTIISTGQAVTLIGLVILGVGAFFGLLVAGFSNDTKMGWRTARHTWIIALTPILAVCLFWYVLKPMWLALG